MCQYKCVTNKQIISFLFLCHCFSLMTEAQQYHVYTLQPLSNPLQNGSSATISTVLSQQQQEYIHEQQELKGIFTNVTKIERIFKQNFNV